MHARPLAVLLVLGACLTAAQPAAAANLPAPARTPPNATVLKGLLKAPLRTIHKPRRSATKRRVRAVRQAALRGIDSWTLGGIEHAGSLGDKQFYYLAYWQWSSKIRSYVLWWDLWVCRGSCARTTVSYFSFYWGGWYGPFGPYRV